MADTLDVITLAQAMDALRGLQGAQDDQEAEGR